MTLPTRLHRVLLACASLASPAAAQIISPGIPVFPEISQGQFSNLAVGMTVVDANQSALWIRAPGANAGVPLPWNATTFGAATGIHPNFSFAALTNWAPQGYPPSFGGISTGGDVTPWVDGSGRMQMQPGLWYMLSIVLAPTAVGLPGSLLNGRVLQGFNPATEILSYYVEGSTGIHPRFVNSQRLEYSASQLALRLGLPATTSPRQIANHDFAMGVISTDTVGATGAMFPIRDRFYFTLTEAYASQLRALPFNIGGEPALSSHVYECIWDTSSLTWQAPGIAFHHDDLFTERAAGSVEIDALSVYMDASTNSKRVVFSLTPGSDQWPDSVFDQILVHQQTAGLTSCPTTELKTNVGTKLSFKQGLRRRTGPGNTPSTGTPDDVKSACGGDPKDGDVVPPVMGLSTDEYRQGEGELGFTAVRRSPPDSAGDELHIQVTGLEHEGYMFGYVWLQLEGPPVPKGSTPAAPVPLGAPILLDAEALDLNSLDLMIPVPRAVGLAPMRFSAQLWGANPGNPPDVRLLRESWVLSVRM